LLNKSIDFFSQAHNHSGTKQGTVFTETFAEQFVQQHRLIGEQNNCLYKWVTESFT